nr:TonB family protein [Altericroceibacterium endophyticum]
MVVGFHLLAFAGLIRAFAPDLTAQAIDRMTAIVTVDVAEPDPPHPKAEPPAEQESGASGDPGKEAVPQEVAAPKPAITRAPVEPKPVAASTGTATRSGAAEQGDGTGAAGEGDGTGSGDGGNGPGAGVSRGLVKIAGNITSARDYPRETRDLRRGHDVIIELRVGADGRVTRCDVLDPSPDPAADAITCDLAQQRFRFEPALDGAGRPIPGRFRWRQTWY